VELIAGAVVPSPAPASTFALTEKITAGESALPDWSFYKSARVADGEVRMGYTAVHVENNQQCAVVALGQREGLSPHVRRLSSGMARRR